MTTLQMTATASNTTTTTTTKETTMNSYLNVYTSLFTNVTKTFNDIIIDEWLSTAYALVGYLTAFGYKSTVETVDTVESEPVTVLTQPVPKARKTRLERRMATSNRVAKEAYELAMSVELLETTVVTETKEMHELEHMTVKELRTLAKERGIYAKSNLRKAQLVETIYQGLRVQ